MRKVHEAKMANASEVFLSRTGNGWKKNAFVF